MAKSEASEETIELYKQLIASTRNVELKGKNMIYTSHNGHMYSFVAKEGYVAIRFSEQEKEAFIEKFKSKPAISYGSVIRGYAVIPNELLAQTNLLIPYLKRA